MSATICQASSKNRARKRRNTSRNGYVRSRQLKRSPACRTTSDSQAISTRPQATSASLRQRAARLLSTSIEFVDNDSFDSIEPPPAERLVPVEAAYHVDNSATRGMPSYVAHLYRTRLLGRTEERQLFCRMNYLKHRAHSLLEHLEVSDPCASRIRQIESFLDEARTIRDSIIEANLRLVVSIAKRLVDQFNSLNDLVSEGNVALMRAVEKFDFGRGFCFSTYATYAIRNSIYRAVNHGRKRRSREVERSDEVVELTTGIDADGRSREREVDALKAAFATMLGLLDPREREIIQARFAMGGRTKPQTLAEIGEEFGVCKERVRQLQIRALRKLRAAATSRFSHVLEDPLIG